MIDVSFIIVSWNARDFLIDCLNSIKDSPENYSKEIIVVDNNSSDGSPEAVESQFPEVKLIRNDDNFGFAKANNIGIRQSSGRYLFFVNSDIKILDNCIGEMVDFMDNNINTGMSGPRILNSDMTLQHSCRKFPFIWNSFCQAVGLSRLFPKSSLFSEPFMKYWEHDTVKKVDVLTGCFWVVRREAMNEVGLLDEDFFFYGEDVDWCRRFNKCRWDVMFNPNAVAIHYGGASSDNAPIRFYLEMQKADLHYWKKHHGMIGRFSYKSIILLRQLIRIFFELFKYLLLPRQKGIAAHKLKRSWSCFLWVFQN